MKFKSILMGTSVLCTSIAVSAPALAQEAQPEGGIADIVVTARKVSENIQTTPVAVTAVTAEAIVAKQINNVSELTRATPGFAALGGGTSSAGVGNYSIRGQSQPNMGSSNDVPVAVYIDGVYYARAQGTNGPMLDMASAEVLRGPQGTLFGRNTTGGALNLTSQSPTQDFGGFLSAGYGNYEAMRLEGAVNLPLSKEVGLRFAGSYDERNGFYRSGTTGKRIGDMNNYFGRASLKWAPEAVPVTVLLKGDLTRYTDNGVPAKLRGVNPLGGTNAAAGAAVLAANLPWNIVMMGGPVVAGSIANTVFGAPVGSNTTGNPEVDFPRGYILARGTSANVEWDMGGATLKSITAYRKNHTNSQWDLDNLYSPGAGVGSANLTNTQFASEYFQHQFSQEFNLSGKMGNLDWMTGFYFFREAGSERSTALQSGRWSQDLTDFTSRSVGVFVQATYHITEAMRATGGLRYTWDRRTALRKGVFFAQQVNLSDALCGVGASTGLLGQPIATLGSVNCREDNSAKFNYPAWLASLDYEAGNGMFLYLKTSGASMAGGINFRFFPAGAEQFSPETVRDVEAGVKADLFGRRLRTNLAVYHIWRKGIQANVAGLTGDPRRASSQWQVNAGKARQYGVELEVTAQPWTGMEVNGAVSYEHSRYVAGTYILGVVDRSADAVAQAPTWTYNIGATQRVPVGDNEISLSADYSYISKYYQYPNSTNALQNQLGSVPARGLLGARIAYQLANPNVEFSLWGKNITNKKYMVSAWNGTFSNFSAGIGGGTPGNPRTWGGTVRVKW